MSKWSHQEKVQLSSINFPVCHAMKTKNKPLYLPTSLAKSGKIFKNSATRGIERCCIYTIFSAYYHYFSISKPLYKTQHINRYVDDSASMYIYITILKSKNEFTTVMDTFTFTSPFFLWKHENIFLLIIMLVLDLSSDPILVFTSL